MYEQKEIVPGNKGTPLNINSKENKERRLKESQQIYEQVKAQSQSFNDLLVRNKFEIERVDGDYEFVSRGLGKVLLPKLTLTVNPVENIPTRTLKFLGNANIRAGDLVDVLIPRFEEKRVQIPSSEFMELHDEKFLLDRPYNTVEKAIELAHIKPDGTILERYVGIELFPNNFS